MTPNVKKLQSYMQTGIKKKPDKLLYPAKWPELESNQRHKDFQSSALPTELSGQRRNGQHSQSADFSAIKKDVS